MRGSQHAGNTSCTLKDDICSLVFSDTIGTNLREWNTQKQRESYVSTEFSPLWKALALLTSDTEAYTSRKVVC